MSDGRGAVSFNEAPAILPGKAASTARSDAPTPERFNEAPAILPGKALMSLQRGRRGIAASMRPRRFCRGKRSGQLRLGLKFGSFNEAPAILPGKAVIRPISRAASSGLQ